ncbi:hypothetical protein CRG98_046382, partial [Punica granatum]
MDPRRPYRLTALLHEVATGEGSESWQPRQSVEKRVGTRAPATARCKIGLVGLLRDGSRRPWVVPNVPSPRQARKWERKFGKSENNPVREKRADDGCARLVGPRTVTTSSRGR